MNHNMNLLAAFSLILLLPGCGWMGKKQTTTKKSSVNMPVKGDKNSKVSFFDDDVEAFVLDEESTMLADGKQDFTWDNPEANIADRFDTICFDYDSAQLRKQEEAKLAKNIQEASKTKDKTIVCKGHSCRYHGTRVYNLALSEQRAKHVAKKFEAKGLKTRVFGVGTEEAKPAPLTKEAQAVNRIVEVYSVVA